MLEKIEQGQWKGWTKTETGFEKKFGKIMVVAEQGLFYASGRRFWTLKDALDAIKKI